MKTDDILEKQIEASTHASLPETEEELLSSPLSSIDNPLPSEESGLAIVKVLAKFIHYVYLYILTYYIYLAVFIILLILILFIK